MKQCLFRGSGLVLAAMVFISGMTVALAAESQTKATIESTNSVVSTSTPWSIVSSSVSDDALELLVLAGSNDNALLGYMPHEVGIDVALDKTLATSDIPLTNLKDIQMSDRWAFQQATINDVSYGLFSLIKQDQYPDLIEIRTYIAPVVTFGQGVDVLQESVTVNGIPILSGLDGASLQSRLESRVSPDDRDAVDHLPPPTSLEIADAAPAETSNAASTTTGRETSGKWTSPRYGVDVEWGSDWRVIGDPVRIDRAMPFDIQDVGTPDRIILERIDGSGATFVFSGWPSKSEPLENWFVSWSIENGTYGFTENLLHKDDPNPKVVGAVVRYIDGPRVGEIHVREARMAYGGMAHIVIDLALPYGSTGGDLQTAITGIMIDGEPAFILVTPDKVDKSLPSRNLEGN